MALAGIKLHVIHALLKSDWLAKNLELEPGNPGRSTHTYSSFPLPAHLRTPMRIRRKISLARDTSVRACVYVCVCCCVSLCLRACFAYTLTHAHIQTHTYIRTSHIFTRTHSHTHTHTHTRTQSRAPTHTHTNTTRKNSHTHEHTLKHRNTHT